MLRYVKSSVAFAALMGVGLITPAMAQDASEMAVRIQQLEEQVRQLNGQVEELSYEVKQLRGQAAPAPMKSGEAQPVQPMPPAAQPALQQKRLAAASAAAPLPESSDGEGVATVESAPLDSLAPPAPAAPQAGSDLALNKAPGPQILGAMNNSAAKPDDGGFQGKVLVPPSQQEPGDDVIVQDNSIQAAPPAGGTDSIETVALSPEAPEALYERSNENLLRRQFGEAEAGFSTFLSKYPDHSLAGSAQYWLGETYYAQGDYRQAAQNFLQGYKKYPKSRRAPDSLLKLGISLNRMGQSEQACAAYQAVSSEYPKAVDARKRAQAEFKRAGCSS